MELYQDLPMVLQDLQQDYMTLPELVERGIDLTTARLERILDTTLGKDFATLPPSLMIPALIERVGNDNVRSDTVNEGLMAMLLLGQLPLDAYHTRGLIINFLSYFA